MHAGQQTWAGSGGTDTCLSGFGRTVDLGPKDLARGVRSDQHRTITTQHRSALFAVSDAPEIILKLVSCC